MSRGGCGITMPTRSQTVSTSHADMDRGWTALHAGNNNMRHPQASPSVQIIIEDLTKRTIDKRFDNDVCIVLILGSLPQRHTNLKSCHPMFARLCYYALEPTS